uniref:Uncharacterized protein n=1 Tax=viral metagenome TaxID=1070528 RepID=A0A6C0HF27_9ZZZZ
MNTLPWVDDILYLVKQEYSKPPPSHTIKKELTQSDEDYIQSIVQEKGPFDTLQLRQEMIKDRKLSKVYVEKSFSHQHGEIILLSYKTPAWTPPYNVWWRAIRLLAKKPVRIVIFAHPSLRLFPPHKHNVEPEHINGGYAQRCDTKSIVIYRKEEITRVLLHELFHSSCSDPYHKPTTEIEADTEAWAEIILCAMVAKGIQSQWKIIMNNQINYALIQASILRDNHNVQTPNDYAWRYAIGRLEVWARLGFSIPSLPTNYKPLQSLRLTYIEPKS